MGTKKQNTKFHDPYTNLAAAIIASGERCHDVSFLNSDWCDTLRTMCRLDDEMYGHHSMIAPGKHYVSSSRVPVEVN